MSKHTIVWLFWGSMIAVAAGILLAFGAAWIAFGSDVSVRVSPDIVDVQTNGWTPAMVVTAGIAVIAIVAGAIGGLVSWIGALLNTAQLTDKTWFVLLLVLGLLSFGLVAMIAYVIAGPDGTKPQLPAENTPVA